MELPLLNDPDLYPSDKVLEETLIGSYPAFLELRSTCTPEPPGLSFEWKYYKDGHAWLCKVVHRKKTVFWLSVWNGYFKTTFYFTEKTGSGIAQLEIDASLKKSFKENKHIGKLIPLTIQILDRSPLKDLLLVIDYKMKQK